MQEKQEKAKERMNSSVECCWGMSRVNEVIRRLLGFSALRREWSEWTPDPDGVSCGDREEKGYVSKYRYV